MAPRAYWKGSLKLSLVSCPVVLYPASTSVEKTRFHMINKETGNRLKQQMVDAETGDVVESDQKGRGYELKKGQYVEIEKEELEAVQIESNHTIEIDSFVPRDEIDKRYFNNPYYIAPDGKAAVDAFAVIRDAMKDEDRVALARIVLTNREHVIAIEPLGKGLLGTTLRYPYELRDEDEYLRRHQEPEDHQGHGRTGEPHPAHQGGAFRSLEVQGRIRGRAEGAGAAQGVRQADQGRRARGKARQRRQPDGCAEGEPEGQAGGEAPRRMPRPRGRAPARPDGKEGAPVGGEAAQGGVTLAPSLRAASEAIQSSCPDSATSTAEPACDLHRADADRRAFCARFRAETPACIAPATEGILPPERDAAAQERPAREED